MRLRAGIGEVGSAIDVDMLYEEGASEHVEELVPRTVVMEAGSTAEAREERR